MVVYKNINLLNFQLTLALEKLAHFHALTYSYAKLNGIKNYEEKFDFFNQIFKNFEVNCTVKNIGGDYLRPGYARYVPVISSHFS